MQCFRSQVRSVTLKQKKFEFVVFVFSAITIVIAGLGSAYYSVGAGDDFLMAVVCFFYASLALFFGIVKRDKRDWLINN